MKRALWKVAFAAAIGITTLTMGTAPAGALASPGFSSTYNMKVGFDGASRFTITGDGYVRVSITQTEGAATRTTIKVDREICGLWGCSWGNYVGGSCERDMYTGRTATCNFNIGNSTRKHRLWFGKANDGQRVKGTVVVS
jgi:hypothetical protein